MGLSRSSGPRIFGPCDAAMDVLVALRPFGSSKRCSRSCLPSLRSSRSTPRLAKAQFEPQLSTGMNLDSEIRNFSGLSAIDQARFLARFLYELTLEARNFYGPGGEQPLEDINKLRFLNEIQHRLTRFIEQILIDDPARSSDEMMLKLLLAPRAEKSIEALVHAAYVRTIQAVA